MTSVSNKKHASKNKERPNAVITDVSELRSIPEYVNTLSLLSKNVNSFEPFHNLKDLTRLFLGGNNISVLEGLAGCEKLEELWLDNQKLPPSEALQLDQRTLDLLSGSLLRLNVSGNHLRSIAPLKTLGKLQFLDASGNDLADLAETVETVANLRSLKEIRCHNNPIAKHRLYTAAMVHYNPHIAYLDDQTVTWERRLCYNKLIAVHRMKARRRCINNDHK